MSFVNGKVALVTGGASGIGLSIVEKLLQCGIKGIGVVDISEQNGKKVLTNLEKTFRGKLIFIKADVTVQKQLEEAFEKTISKFKNLDIVINNAGIVNETEWEKTLSINLESVLRGTYLAMDKYLPKYKSGEEGVIVNTASILGLCGSDCLPTYCATKHGVVGLGKALGTENNYINKRIRIITICPGVVETPLVSKDIQLKDAKGVEEVLKLSKIVITPEFIALNVVKIINEGKNGSIWVIEDNLTYEIVIPERIKMKKT